MNPVKRMKESNAASARAAALLTSVGMTVAVRMDLGKSMITTTASMPWQLGHGAWVVSLVGIRGGGYDCARVTPVVES